MKDWTARDDRSSPGRSAAAPGNPILRDLLWIVAAGALGIGTVLALLPAAGHDQLWCLYVAGRMLDGARLYGPEIFESNPPLIMWLSELPVALARPLHVEPGFGAKLVTLLALAAIFPLTLRCLRMTGGNDRNQTSRQWSLPLLALFFAIAFLCIPARDFGQREHLLSFLVLPYLVLAARQTSAPAWLPVLAGGLAALGICLKPQQAIFPMCVEALLIVRARSWKPLQRPEPWLLLGLCTAYVAAIRLVTPAYFSEILPILRQTYWAIGHLTVPMLLQQSMQLQALGLACAALLCSSRVRTSVPAASLDLVFVLAVAGAGSDVAYLQQGTGWYYQQLPAIVFFTGALFVLAAQLAAARGARGLHAPAWTRYAATGFALFAMLLTLHCSGYPVTRDRAYAITSPDPAIFRTLPEKTPVAILTTSVDEAMMPVARYNLVWAQRTNNLWWMPAILRSEAENPSARSLRGPQLTALAALQRRNMTEDLRRWRPEIVLVERCQDPEVHCQVIEDLHPDLLHWFAQDEDFRKAFADYRLARTDGQFDVYLKKQRVQTEGIGKESADLI